MKEELFGLLLFLLSTSAIAQANCGGVHVGGGACLPPGDPRLGGGAATAPAPIVRWADRWGAIANDGNGIFGIVSDMPSKRRAEEAAISECRKRGGANCFAEFSYHNQCVAVGSNEKATHTASSPSIDEAKATAVQNCEARSGEKCIVYYSGCSMPVRVQ